MAFRETKVYFDGSHYVAIPYNPGSNKPRRFQPEEVIEILKKRSSTGPPEVQKTTKKEIFEESYKEAQSLPKKEREKHIKETMEQVMSDEEASEYVEANIRRKKQNLTARRVRMMRKANLMGFNYFCTFTYDSNLISEADFKKRLSKCLSNLTGRKGWKYIGVWERSPDKQRLHFHGIFNIPEGGMVGELIERKDYNFSEHRRKVCIENTFFKERFGRNDFEHILDTNGITKATTYILKYIEKTGEKIVYSRGLPQFFISDIMDDDIICRIGVEDKKLLLFDNFICWDEGVYIGEVSPETISKLRKSN